MAYVKKTDNPRMGRPTKNPRTADLTIRLTPIEYEVLTELSEKTGKTKTAIIVEGIKLVRKRLAKESEE